MDCQFISKYGKFVTSQTASFSRADIRLKYRFRFLFRDTVIRSHSITGLPKRFVQAVAVDAVSTTILKAYYTIITIIYHKHDKSFIILSNYNFISVFHLII